MGEWSFVLGVLVLISLFFIIKKIKIRFRSLADSAPPQRNRLRPRHSAHADSKARTGNSASVVAKPVLPQKLAATLSIFTTRGIATSSTSVTPQATASCRNRDGDGGRSARNFIIDIKESLTDIMISLNKYLNPISSQHNHDHDFDGVEPKNSLLTWSVAVMNT